MANHLASIGFSFASPEAFQDTMERLATAAAERLVATAGEFAIWRSRTGAELWFHLAWPEMEGGTVREIVGLTPAFEGRSLVRVRLTEQTAAPDGSDFDGTWSGWVCAQNKDDPVHGITFEAIGFAACDVQLPYEGSARIAAFADAYSIVRAQATDDVPKLECGRGETRLAGRIMEAQKLRNEETSAAFWWLLVEGPAGALYDFVAATTLIDGPIARGSWMDASCWLVGRLLEPEPPPET